MIQRIIEWSLKNRFLVFCGALLIITLGVRAVFKPVFDSLLISDRRNPRICWHWRVEKFLKSKM